MILRRVTLFSQYIHNMFCTHSHVRTYISSSTYPLIFYPHNTYTLKHNVSHLPTVGSSASRPRKLWLKAIRKVILKVQHHSNAMFLTVLMSLYTLIFIFVAEKCPSHTGNIATESTAVKQLLSPAFLAPSTLPSAIRYCRHSRIR
jgi:hypothetical protein